MRRTRLLTTAPVAAALVAFALPFATVSCGPVVVEPRGLDLVVGRVPEARCDPSRLEEGDSCTPRRDTVEEERENELLLGSHVVARGGAATLAFVALVLAAVFAVRRAPGVAAAVSLLAVVALASLGRRRDPLFTPEGDPAVTIDLRVGWWAAVAFAAAGAVASGAVWRRGGGSLRPLRTPAFAGAALLAGALVTPNRLGYHEWAYADQVALRRPWEALWPTVVFVLAAVIAPRLRSSQPQPFAAGVLAGCGALALVAGAGHVATSLAAPLESRPWGSAVLAVGAALVLGSAVVHVRAVGGTGPVRPRLLPIAGGVAAALLAAAAFQPFVGPDATLAPAAPSLENPHFLGLGVAALLLGGAALWRPGPFVAGAAAGAGAAVASFAAGYAAPELPAGVAPLGVGAAVPLLVAAGAVLVAGGVAARTGRAAPRDGPR